MFNDKEKVFTYLVIAFVCVIFIVLMFVIWRPSSQDSIENKIRNFDVNTSYNTQRIEFYNQNILNMLNNSNFNSTYENVSKKFLEENNLANYEDTYDFLQQNMFIASNLELLGVELISDINDIYIYKVTYSVSGKNRYVIITENDINTFELYFSDDGLIDNIDSEKIIIKDNVEYKVEVIESRVDSIKLNLTITNNSSDRYEYNFTDLYSVQALLDDNSAFNLTSVVLGGEDSYILNPNSNFTIELVYQIPQGQQASINRLKFRNVLKNDIEQDIVVYY